MNQSLQWPSYGWTTKEPEFIPGSQRHAPVLSNVLCPCHKPIHDPTQWGKAGRAGSP